jgi:tetratricopeptide (TPR) repeat protein
VLVLQNLGLPRVPVWHYAVAIGYDAQRDAMVLRSGTERRRLERSRRFLRSWQRGADWAFVAVEPGSLPATATPDAYARAVADAERLLPPDSAHAAFAAALERWPDDELLLFAAANHELRARATPEAIALYRRLLELHPRHAAARNNLANALADQGCYSQALAEARAARAAATAGDPLSASIDDTVATLERAAAAAPGATCP